ncbi:MAG: hypothetical protein JWO78_1510 [Micavibrio sp.]|nr:hypothetical protein [Micavibrio sp.]
MEPTDIEQPGAPNEPQAPVTPAPAQQPGQGDDFTKPGKKNEQADMGRPGDEPVEQQDLTEDDEDDLDFELDEEQDDASVPTQTH